MKKLLTGIILLLAVFVVWFVWGALTGDSPSEEPSQSETNELLSANPQEAQSILDANLQEATDLSRFWELSSQLAYVEVSIPVDFSLDGGSELYVFSSSEDSANWWTFSLNQQTDKFVRAIIPKEDFLGFDPTIIDSDFWQMNYIEALQLADQNGGVNFRSNNDLASIKVYLKQREPNGWLWWTVEYISTGGLVFERLINPFDGAIRDSAGNPIQ